MVSSAVYALAAVSSSPRALASAGPHSGFFASSPSPAALASSGPQPAPAARRRVALRAAHFGVRGLDGDEVAVGACA